MEIRVEINKVDRSNLINWANLNITKNLTSLVDTCLFQITKIQDGYIPSIYDEVEIYNSAEVDYDSSIVDYDDPNTPYDGTSTKLFGGFITSINEDLSIVDGGIYQITCQDYTFKLAGILVAKSYTNKTGAEIINDIISEFAPEFDTVDVVCDSVINKIVFNQVNISDCLTRLSKIIGYEWYVGASKDIHFFKRFSLIAPVSLTDTNGSYIYKTLKRTIDGTQVANQVKVRGGMGTETTLFDDTITVNGSDTLALVLPYRFSDFKVYLNGVEQNVGIDNIDDFTNFDVLYNYQDYSMRFENNLASGDLVRYTGYKKYPVMAVVSDEESIALIGLREKMIVDNTLENATTARERAFLELELSKDSITDCSFNTYQAGLETGMRLTVGSDLRNINELDFIITKVVFKTRTPADFQYSVSCSTARKMGLTEFLKELATRGDVFTEDETEVAEIIKSDLSEIQIEEDIQAITASEDNANYQVEELIQNSDVEPIWVWGYYIPTGTNDPKRMGRFDRGAKWQ